MKKILIFFSALVFLLGLAATQATRPTLYIIGDSTVRNGSGKGTDGLWGWGSLIPAYFDTTRLHIENHAIGGRSSRTFLSEGRWDKIMAVLKPGDYVLMQFGHNDAGAINDTIRARGSIKGTGDETEEIDNLLTKQHEIVHSYGWYLKKYINDTKQKGATPIVCSLVPRNVWKDGHVERSSGSYGKWAAESAASGNAFFIDLNEIIARKYEAGYNEARLKADFFPGDHTHTNYAGARFNAEAVMEGLGQLKGCSLNRYRRNPAR
ncbi:rhamnogalacturonan acetylesterase [Spirosoma taeanense]|uniref:Rhamnogalacturonan acetylesterase n=1 Tax=Spirosoma taeanense TaxID=2735870 RepID=A0A6M5YAI8_9BACT|nr:rhamnogalacturonan acetylesterase [Spirosoma taeanense]QJW90376.1 rhamnogalacturonan acetylesterase [Spirosoma taeanense]